MKPAPFTLHRPRSLDAALALLDRLGEDGALVLAGGQSLVPMMALRAVYPGDLVDINAIPGLDRLEVGPETLTIGALVRHARFHRPVCDDPLGALLTAVCARIAHYPIRQRGTFCGSLAHADPASEWCLVAATLGGSVQLASTAGTRRLAADAFLEGPLSTARAPGELVLAAELPLLGAGTRWGFYEFNRRSGDFALGMALVTFALQDGRIAAPRVGLGAIEDRPRRIPEAEALLDGAAPGPGTFAAAATAAAAAVEPMEDPGTEAAYRRDLAAVAVRRALAAALDGAHGAHPAAATP